MERNKRKVVAQQQSILDEFLFAWKISSQFVRQIKQIDRSNKNCTKNRYCMPFFLPSEILRFRITFPYISIFYMCACALESLPKQTDIEWANGNEKRTNYKQFSSWLHHMRKKSFEFFFHSSQKCLFLDIHPISPPSPILALFFTRRQLFLWNLAAHNISYISNLRCIVLFF